MRKNTLETITPKKVILKNGTEGYLTPWVDNTMSADEITASLANKVNTADLEEVQCVVETYQNGASWYRVWSDGWCEQGGTFTWSDNGTKGPITLLKPMGSNTYSVTCQTIGAGSDGSDTINIYSRSNTNFYISAFSSYRNMFWQVSGYIEV